MPYLLRSEGCHYAQDSQRESRGRYSAFSAAIGPAQQAAAAIALIRHKALIRQIMFTHNDMILFHRAPLR